MVMELKTETETKTETEMGPAAIADSSRRQQAIWQLKHTSMSKWYDR